MAQFIYNITKNKSISYIFFELHYSYHFYISYKKNLKFYFKLKVTNKLASK